MGLIYMRTSPSGGRYIGKTTIPEEERWKQHVQESKRSNNPNYNDLLNKAIRKYGANNFKVQILEDNLFDEALNKREQYWIRYYNTYYLDNEHGYNMTRGGEGGIKYDGEKFLELWQQGKNCLEISLIFNCQPQTVSQRLKGLGITSEEIAKRQAEFAQIQNATISKYAKEIVEKWRNGKSQTALSQEYHCHRKTISNILHNDPSVTIEEFKQHKSISNINNKLSKPVIQLTLTGDYIAEWPSAAEAGRQYNSTSTNILRVCTGERQTAFGFKWKYKESN